MDELTDVQKELLVAAYHVGARPGSRYRKSAEVLLMALGIAGRADGPDVPDKLRIMKLDTTHPVVQDFYAQLVALVRHQPTSDALMYGMGNFGTVSTPPAYPPYTECRLSEAGAKLAEELMKHHPEFAEPTE